MILDTLWSYAYHKNTDLAEARAALDGLIVLDSGAFTAFTSGKTITVTEYADWLTKQAGQYDYAVTLDVIGDPAATQTNTNRLRDLGHDVCPVITTGTDLSVIDGWADDGHALIFAGGLVGLPRSVQTDYLRAVARRAEQHGIGVHALGVGGPTTLRRSGCWGGDSSAPFMSRMRGQVMVWDAPLGGPRLKSASDRTHLREHADWLTSCGLDVGELYRGDTFKRKDAAEVLARSALASYSVTGYFLRENYPRRFDRLPTGPRLMAAVGGSIKDMVFRLGAELRDNPPAAATRAAKLRTVTT